MGDMGDIFSEFREAGKVKRNNNLLSSIKILTQNKIEFKKLSDTHVRVKDFDFWPSTGLFINTKTKKRGRGVFNLIQKLKELR